LKTHAFTFLIILIFGISCNGQVKKDLPKEKASESKIISAGHVKLIKTQGSQKSENVSVVLQTFYISVTTFYY
jgi:Na+-transporting methylmalonyl-CoA/oxaloacetate decarboxylase gamma subunit